MTRNALSFSFFRRTGVGLLLLCATAFTLRGQTAFDLLSGFDAQRLESVYPIEDRQDVGEMAKLLYRLRKADPKALAARRQASTGETLAGQVVSLSGTIERLRQYPVPEDLTAFLELDAFYEITLADESSETPTVVFAPPLPGDAGQGDRMTGDAVFLTTIKGTEFFAAGTLAWMPVKSDRPGWRLLSEQRVDLGQVARMGQRNGRSLESDDAETFYSMLAAAKGIGRRDKQSLPTPKRIDPVDLLQNPVDYHGSWIRIEAVTVRVTRVAVDSPDLRARLGQDHYYQVDASGDLEKTVVQLQRVEGEMGEPILISGSYPISLVTTDLPSFLSQRMDQSQDVVAMVSYPVAIEGFFMRLWSYENEFMRREGGGKQVGPLVVASKWFPRRTLTAAEEGIELIGYALAAAIILAIVTTFVWTRRNAKADDRARRRHSASETIELPPT